MSTVELFHFHRLGNIDTCNSLYDENKENRVISIVPKFSNALNKRYNNFSTNVNNFQKDRDINFENYINDVLKKILYDKKFDGGEMLKLLGMAHDISMRSNEFKRETALEDFRKTNCKCLPSRLHCMYFTDEKGIEYWKEILGNKESLILFRAEIVNSNIFKTNEYFLPDERLSYEKVYSNAGYYWHPNFKNAPSNSNEYLVQGRVKLKEIIKRF